MAALSTTTMRVGTMVLAADFRHPAALGRELASVDLLSEGRLEVGLGAGYKRLDYEQSGIPMDAPAVRVGRLIEYVAVLRGLFGTEPFSFAGEHFRIDDLEPTPSPYRPGGPPIIIGGGAPRLLRFAGAAADIVGINPSIHSGVADSAAARDGAPDRIDTKLGWVKEGAGGRFDALEINAWVGTCEITDTAAARADALAPRFGVTPADVLTAPTTLIGTEEEIIERLHERRERWGYSYHVFRGEAAHAFAPIVQQLAGT
jgi:probable F420-dependent oxidoreductase